MADKLFDFGDVTSFLTSVGNAVSQKAVAAKETAQVAASESQHLVDVTADYTKHGDEALNRLSKIESDQAEAARLAESDNIFDRITLIGEQIINPRAYTHEGRQNQVAEISQDLAVRGQIANIDAAASDARVNAAKAQEALATVDLDTNLLKVKTQVDALALTNEALRQTETLRQNKLVTFDAPVLHQALIGPTPADGKIVLDGMKYTPLEIRERAQALDNREKVSMLTPQASDPDFAGKLAVQHSLALATYTLPELDQLKNNGYIMPDGTQVQPDVWDKEYNRKQQLQQDMLIKQMNDTIVRNQVPVAISDSTAMLKAGEKYITPGSPLALAANQFKAELGTVAAIADKDNTPVGKEIQLKQLGVAQQAYAKAVQDEALRKANGDKDLAGIYTDQMFGVPIDSGRLEDVVVSRFVKQKGFGDFLPSDTSKKLQVAADQELTVLRQQQVQIDMGGLGSKKSESELREQAVRSAFDRIAKDKAVDTINTIQRLSYRRKDHPAAIAGMAPGQIEEVSLRASSKAAADVMEQEGVTPEQFAFIQAGNYSAAGVSDDKGSLIAQEYNATALSTEYDLLEAQKPGLGYQTQQWYMKNMGEMARAYVANMDPMENALTGDQILTQASTFSNMYTAVDESANKRASETAAQMAVGAKRPENFWPIMLEMDRDLADSQKQQIFYDVITPALQQAKSLNMSPEQAMDGVFTALSQFKSDDQVLGAAVKNFSRNLPKSLDSFEKTWKVMTVPSDLSTIPASPSGEDIAKMAKDPDNATKRLHKLMPWLDRGKAPN